MTLIESLNKLLSFNIFKSSDSNRDYYNRYVTNISEQIVSFLVNHYKCDRLDTPFWRYVYELESPLSLQKIKKIKELDTTNIKKIFNINRKDSVAFTEKSYQIVDYGHIISKKKSTLI
jgi:hypothetical protein